MQPNPFCFTLLLLSCLASCSNSDEKAAPTMGDRYPDNLTYVEERCTRVGFHSLKKRERIVLCLGRFEKELRMGGVLSFFESTAGDHTGATLDALSAVGASAAKDLLGQAIRAAFEGQLVPIDRKERVQLLSRPSVADRDRLAEKLAVIEEQIVNQPSLADQINDWLKAKR